MNTGQVQYEVLEHEKYETIKELKSIKKLLILSKCTLGLAAIAFVIKILSGENPFGADVITIATCGVAPLLDEIGQKNNTEKSLTQIEHKLLELGGAEDKIR